jgi:3',5'-cyclic AMP phosphodiesterase CpdA
VYPQFRRAWRLLSALALLAALAGPGAAAEPRSTHFFFVQITDTHWGARDGLKLTRQIVDAVNALPMPIEFVVHTGDMLADSIGNGSVVSNGLAAMSQLKAPVHYVPGNHDISKKRAKSAAALYRTYFGPLSHRAEFHGVVCLFLYTEPLVATGSRVEGYEPLDWLKEQLKLAGNQPVLIFQHGPPVEDVVGSKNSPGWSAESRDAMEAVVGHNPRVKAIVAGHFHRDELHWLGDTPVYIGSSVARFWDRQPSYRIYEYRDGRLGYWTVYL